MKKIGEIIKTHIILYDTDEGLTTFIDKLKNSLLDNFKYAMGNLIVPILTIILAAVGVFSLVSGVIKFRSKSDDFKGHFITAGVCISIGALLGVIWLWAITAVS